MSQPIFEKLGLTSTEATLYDFLLNRGEMPAFKIIEDLNIKRATAYKSLYGLEKRGLVSIEDRDKILHFKPLSPDKLATIADSKLDEAKQIKSEIVSLLPSLSSTYTLTVEKPVIRTFEGVDGIKEIYMDTLREKSPIFAALTTATVEPSLFKWLTSYYAQERVKAGIEAKVIASTGDWAGEYHKLDKDELRETRLVPQSEYPFEHEVDIYGDKIAFIDYKKGSKLIGVIISHPTITKTTYALWKLAWERAGQNLGSLENKS